MDYKKLIGELLGTFIAVAWIAWALIWPGNTVGLVIALAITILFGTMSGGLIARNTQESQKIQEKLQKEGFKDIIPRIYISAQWYECWVDKILRSK